MRKLIHMMPLPDAQATVYWGGLFSSLLRKGDALLLKGELGVGKTSFARGILQGLGYKQEVPSPSFAIVQHYGPPEITLPLGHVDLYRLNARHEIDEIGLEEYYDEGILLVEWPELLNEYGYANALEIRFFFAQDKAVISKNGYTNGRWMEIYADSLWEERLIPLFSSS